jgi:hypothetical protein
MDLEKLVQTLSQTHRSLQQQATRSVNFSLVVRNWLFGYYIVEFEQRGSDRAQYGSRLLAGLSNRLKSTGIPSCSVSNLRNFRQFYQTYSEIHQTVSGELLNPLPLEQLSQKFCLSWSHYQVLVSLPNAEERVFYECRCSVTSIWRRQDEVE